MERSVGGTAAVSFFAAKDTPQLYTAVQVYNCVPENCSLKELFLSAGFYTAWLLPAAVVGTLVFMSGVMSMSSNTPA